MNGRRILLLVAVVALVLVGVETLTPPGPPRSTLSFGGETQTGKLGPSCWIERRWLGPGGVCGSADSEVPPVPAESISGPAGSAMVFDYGGEGAPAELQAMAYPLESNRRPTLGGRSEPRGILLPTDQSADGTEIRASLPPGEYSVRVAVTVPRTDRILTGEAVYGFHVVAT